jgi:hypothetical protein
VLVVLIAFLLSGSHHDHGLAVAHWSRALVSGCLALP